MKLKYAVVIEKAPNNYCAYAPDVLGCISTSKTRDEMLAMMREALEFHIETMLEDGESVPEPRSSLADAMRHHIAVYEEESSGDEFADWEETETSFVMLEIEVAESARTVWTSKPVAVASSESARELSKHRIFQHPTKSGNIVISGHPEVDMKKGATDRILKNTGPK